MLKLLIKSCMASLLLLVSNSLFAEIKVYGISISPRLMTKPGDTLSLDISGKTDKDILSGQIHTTVTLYGGVIYDITQNLCTQLSNGRCPIKKDDLLTIHKNVITSTTMPDGWYNIHVTVTDQDNETIVDAKKCFKINNNCSWGFLCYL